ncbi:MAG: type 4a pilus biogenesis protein PilO [Actinobacteria bacterium]|nr:type 4a pilus biogenesis protein PilO [Chloroflexota bacterium]MCL5292300.1 type 4a pilus biogenesis protein PilO [Actinomycetota bacterium]
MNKLNFQQQLIAFAVLLVSALALFYYFAWKPQSTELETINNQRQQEEQKIQSARATLARLEAVKNEAPRIEAKIIKIGRKMPKEPQLPELIVHIQNMANDAGVDVATLQPREPTSLSGYSQMDITLSIEGTYMQIDDFLYRIENSPRAMRVNDFSISGSAHPKLKSGLTISTFILNEGAPAPAVPPVAPQGSPGKT